MSDTKYPIVERFRVEAPDGDNSLVYIHPCFLREAAGLIEELIEAVKPFSDYAPDAPASIFPDDASFTQGSPLARRQLTFGDLRRARAALAKAKGEAR